MRVCVRSFVSTSRPLQCDVYAAILPRVINNRSLGGERLFTTDKNIFLERQNKYSFNVGDDGSGSVTSVAIGLRMPKRRFCVSVAFLAVSTLDPLVVVAELDGGPRLRTPSNS